MIQDAASLENLRDIAEPAPVSWWPLAPGWWAVIFVVLVAAVILAAQSIRKWQRDAYRRAALRELDTAGTPAAIDAILKRTALSVWPRDRVAALSGQQWCDWLSSTSATPMPDSAAVALTNIFRTPSDDISSLAGFARNWIQNHRIEKTASS